MKLGIKVGPSRNNEHDIEETHPAFVEVWFDITKADDYDDLFSYLDKQHIPFGLHFWGKTRDGIWPTIAYPDASIIKESMNLMRETIDITARHNGLYVNIHPSPYAKITVDYPKQRYTVLTPPSDLPAATHRFMDNVLQISAYAKDHNVLLTIETTSLRVANRWIDDPVDSRSHAFPIFELPIAVFPEIQKHGLAIANDFGHTASSMISDDPNAVRQYLTEKTQEFLPSTKLLHLGFIIPPYSGMDFHDELDNPIFDTQKAIPDKNQFLELLKLFSKQPDVLALVEPRLNHAKNFFLAQKLLLDAGVLDPRN